MKDYKNLLETYDKDHTIFIQHEWGQNKYALYNLVAKAWNQIAVDDKIVITSYKHFGIKSSVEFLKKHGINSKITGKGPENLRLVECTKTSDKKLNPIITHRNMEFIFRGKKYHVDIGDAVFSKTGLDEGTRILLETILDENIDLNNKQIADFGSGWGAISLILVHEFPKIKIVAYEKDESSFEAARKNLEPYSQVSVLNADLTNKNDILMTGGADYIISNPPFHSKAQDKELFFQTAHKLLNKGGELIFVTERSFMPRFKKVLQTIFTFLEEKPKGLYIVLRYKK